MSLFAGLPPIGSRLSDDEGETGASEKQQQQPLEKGKEPQKPIDLVPASLRPRPAAKRAHDPARLISRWTAAAASSAAEAAPQADPPEPLQPAVSLAQYLPAAPPRQDSGCRAVFDPRAAYCPATPNDYHAYAAWAAERKKKGRKASARDHPPS